MKNALFFLLIAAAFTSSAQSKPQSLKDLLYGGKLKSDSGTVIRKSDDLSTKIDTTTKKPAAPTVTKTKVVADSSRRLASPTAEMTTLENPDKEPASMPVKSASRVWKEYTDSLATALKGEVLSSKKIKKQTYYVTVEYELGADGSTAISGVTSDPENAFLQDQIKERMTAAPPQVPPVLDSNGKPRKVKKRYNFSVTKD